MKNNKANREGFLEKIIVWLMLAFFWGIIIFHIANSTLLVIISGILFTICNFYGCNKLLENKKSKIQGFFIVESIPLVFYLLIAFFKLLVKT